MVTFTPTSRNHHKDVPRVSQTTNNGWKTINTKATVASINDKDENKWPGSADDQKDDDDVDEKPTVGFFGTPVYWLAAVMCPPNTHIFKTLKATNVA